MKSYLELVPISARAHKKQSRMTRLCIVLAVFLVAVIFGMADTEIRSQKLQAIQTDGAWEVSFRDISSEQADLIDARQEVDDASWYGTLNYRLDEDYTVAGEQVGVCGFDESLATVMPAAALVEGTFPRAGQTALTISAKDQLGLSIGDVVDLNLPNGVVRSFEISGFAGDLSMLMKSDALGMFVNTETLRELCADAGVADTVRMYLVVFKSGTRIEAAAADIASTLGIADEQVQENVKLLGIMGQSSDSYMSKLYMTAGVLALLVIVAGILMITSSLGANVANRTEFFGLMRCLGATPRQVMRFVRLEALTWCLTAIPIGLGAAVVVVWGLCAMLKALSPSYFASMPAFGISWIALVAGLVIGLAAVLLAAARPARRASKCSPQTAVSGNAGLPRPIKHAANTRLLSVDAALGVHHASGDKKNFLLMAGSFALSIVLFLSFTVAVDFMHHAIRPLKPYTPDLSIISEANECSISKDLLQALEENPAVKKAYGRMFAYDVPVTVGHAGDEAAASASSVVVKANVISYEQNQFDWTGDSLLAGSTASVETGKDLLGVFDAESPLVCGDTVTLDCGETTQERKLAGMLSDSPFAREEGTETLICSEDTFHELTGETGYTIIDIQLRRTATDEDVAAIRALAGMGMTFSDQRLENQEAREAFYSFSLFVYGFLFVILLISAINIKNSIALSVSARMRQYGAMRAIGMSVKQLRTMVLFEAGTHAVAGIALGLAIGIPINNLLYSIAVTSYWGDVWSIPMIYLCIIIGVVALSVVIAVIKPIQRIRNLSIVDTIHAQ